MATFSSDVSEHPSPTVPQTMRPDTPSRMSPSITRAVAPRSSVKFPSFLNWVVTAGKTPVQEQRFGFMDVLLASGGVDLFHRTNCQTCLRNILYNISI